MQQACIAVLITCHNRRAFTVACVESLALAADASRTRLRVFLVDDGSTDGTAFAVRAIRPDATIIQGSGKLFWNGGMRLAWLQASQTIADFYLWLNDDLALLPNSIDNMMALWRAKQAASGGRVIVVGRTTSRATGKTTYGGYMRAGRLSRLNFRRRRDGDPETCTTMNGNCVLLPASASLEIGINSRHYTHGMGDIDYGLRARRNGYDIVELQAPVGYQEANVAWIQSVATLNLNNWRYIFLSPKGIPLREWLHFCRQHGGCLWPLNFVYRYIKILL